MKPNAVASALICLLTGSGAGFCATADAAAGTTVEAIYAEAAADCANTDNGSFSPGEAPVLEVDLTGDGAPEQIVNKASFTCSTLASFYGGTGGAPIIVLAQGKRFEWTVLGYQIVNAEYLPAVLLMTVHGSACGGAGSDACVEAAVWGGEGFNSVRAPAD